MSLFSCHSLHVTLQPLLKPSCLVGISPDLVLASQTPYSKLLRFQNKQQKEGVNLRAAKFAIRFWLSWNRSAMLLVSTTTDFQASPHIARFLPCLHPPSFSRILCPPRPPFSHQGLSRWCHPIVAAGWKLGRSGSGERRVLRPGAACSASPREWIRGAKSCLFSCLCSPDTSLAVFGVWKPYSSDHAALCPWDGLLGLVLAHEIPAEQCWGVCVLLVFHCPLPGCLQLT